MNVPPLVRTATFALLGAALVAAEDAAPRPAAAAETLHVYHWWTSASEVAALKNLVEAFNAKHHEVAVELKNATDSRLMFLVTLSHMKSGNAPDAFQMHTGYSMQPYVDADLLAPLDDVWAAEGLDKVVPPVLQDMSRLQGHYYALPIDVHRTNVVWYNKPLLDKHHIDVASLQTWDGFFAAAETLRAEGVAAPIALGVNWTATHTFECIMASLGMPAYEDWINGKITSPSDPRMIQAFTIYKKYRRYVNEDNKKLEWDAAIKRVIKGESAFAVMGDWADGEFRIAGLTYGREYGTFAVPGTDKTFGVTIDAFLRPRGLASATNADRWFKVVASRDGQDAFNPQKGSIPPRTDTNASRYGLYQKASIAQLKSARTVFASLGAAVPPNFKWDLDEVLDTFAADLDVEKAAAAMAAVTEKAEKKYTRVWSLK
jgi:glucose/mannose transport system substrate-binding protein